MKVKNIFYQPKLADIFEQIKSSALDRFKFDYVIMSEINDHYSKIGIKYCATNDSTKVDPQKWQSLANFDLTDTDILADVVRTRKMVSIHGPNVVKNWDIRLNKNIFNQFHHEELTRIFCPVTIKVKKLTREYNDVIAVVEVGFHISSNREIDRQLEISFDHALSNIVAEIQLKSSDNEKEILLEISKFVNSNEPSINLLKFLLQKTIEITSSTFGDIAFLETTNESIFLKSIELGNQYDKYYKLTKELDIGHPTKIGITGNCIRSTMPYWSNDVGNDEFYIKDFDEINSELAIPLKFEEEIIGVLDLYSTETGNYDLRIAGLVEEMCTYTLIIFHRMKIDEALHQFVGPFNLFTSVDSIYKAARGIIEKFLNTSYIVFWENKGGNNFIDLRLNIASEELKRIYEKYSITRLSSNSYSAKALKNYSPAVLSSNELKSPNFDNNIVLNHFNFNSCLILPISIGNHSLGVLDVFFFAKNRPYSFEVEVLKLLTNKLAIAIVSSKIVKSFNSISNSLPNNDIKFVLKNICDNAFDVLNTGPIIVYRFYSDNGKLFAEIHKSGFFFNPTNLTSDDVIEEDDFVKAVLNDGNLYLQNRTNYLQVLEKNNLKQNHNNTNDFWTREKIKSLAAIPLKIGENTLGIMFINFREEQKFTQENKVLIQAFASLASAAIYNSDAIHKNLIFFEQKRKESFLVSIGEIMAYLIHETAHLLSAINSEVINFRTELEADTNSKIDRSISTSFLENITKPLQEITDEFYRLRDYKNFEDLNIEKNSITEIIENSIKILTYHFKKNNIDISISCPQDFFILCDKNRITHVMINLLLNSIQAVRKKGTISISVKKDEHKEEVIITIIDNGEGIKKENYEKIFQPFFTTKKKSGTGLGLPICKYIVEASGGYIQFSSKKGAAFSVHLPINNES
jgi:signal transduction histidine kinase